MHIAFLRHGPTQWNEEGRIQGRIDVPLSAAGRTKMAALLPPEGFETVRAFVSPLGRARESALLLNLVDPVIDERLSEHDWGQWQGLTRGEILSRDGANAFELAGRGIDFQPKGGESTRELLARVADFLRDVARHPSDAIVITHRGILRSAYVLATGWDMATPMPEKLDLSQALILSVEADGSARVGKLNAPLRPRRA